MARPLRYVLSPSWRCTVHGEGVRLGEAVSGKRLELSPFPVPAGRQGQAAAARFEQALEALEPEQRREVIGSLLAQGALRLFRPGALPTAGGRGTLLRPLWNVLGGGGWTLPPLTTGGVLSPGRAVHLLPFAHGVIALSGQGGPPCTTCLELRYLATLAWRGRRQRRVWGLAPRPRWAEPLIARCLVWLQANRLEKGVALLSLPRRELAWGPFLVHPDCGRCSPAKRNRVAALRRALERAPRRPQKRAVDALTDPTFGPVTLNPAMAPRVRKGPPIPLMFGGLRFSRAREGRVWSASRPHGVFGKALDEGRARLLAISEGVERLAAMGARADFFAPGDRAVPGAIPLGDLFPAARRSPPRGRRGFVEGLDLMTGRACALPLEAVAVGLPRGYYPQAAHREPFFSGTASHRTLKEAIIHATLELLERDALMISWYRRRRLPRLRWPGDLDGPAAVLSHELRARGFELELFQLTLDVPVPTLLLRVTARRRVGGWRRGGAMLLSASAFNAARALERALWLAYVHMFTWAMSTPPDDPLDAATIRRESAHLAGFPLMVRYLDPARRSGHRFLAGPPRPFEDLPGDEPASPDRALARLRAWLAERKLSWLVVRLTDENAQRAGLEVAKVVIPGLVRAAPSRRSVGLRQERMRRNWPHASAGLHPEPHPLF